MNESEYDSYMMLINEAHAAQIEFDELQAYEYAEECWAQYLSDIADELDCA